MLPINPWTIKPAALAFSALIAVLALVGSFIAGDSFGYTRGADATEAAYSAKKDVVNAALAASLDEARSNAAKDREAAKQSAAREAAAKRTLESTLKGLRDAPLVPADCVPDGVRLRLNAVVDTINRRLDARAGDTGAVSGPVPASAAPGEGK